MNSTERHILRRFLFSVIVVLALLVGLGIAAASFISMFDNHTAAESTDSLGWFVTGGTVALLGYAGLSAIGKSQTDRARAQLDDHHEARQVVRVKPVNRQSAWAFAQGYRCSYEIPEDPPEFEPRGTCFSGLDF